MIETAQDDLFDTMDVDQLEAQGAAAGRLQRAGAVLVDKADEFLCLT